jgi:hypothetical protein
MVENFPQSSNPIEPFREEMHLKITLFKHGFEIVEF